MSKDNLLIYIPIAHKDKVIKKAHEDFIDMMLSTGWIHGGTTKLKDETGEESEFTILMGSLDK